LILLGALGAAIGSFLNVVIHRVPLSQSIMHPPSSCPGCGHAIRAFDNVPVLSWLVLRGRCRDCGIGISPRYPLVEIAGAAAFVGLALVDGFTWMLALELPFAALLIAVAAIDFDHRIIPNRLIYPAAVYAPIALALIDPGLLPEHLIAGAVAFLLFLLVALAYPAGMGMGDVKLAGVMGLYLGLSVAPALLVAFAAGSLVGVGLMLVHGASARKRALPFGPFLALGGMVGLLAGPALIALYSSLFLP
jgi:leader peptidase (prepilin peptidase)/N-methyltransferase